MDSKGRGTENIRFTCREFDLYLFVFLVSPSFVFTFLHSNRLDLNLWPGQKHQPASLTPRKMLAVSGSLLLLLLVRCNVICVFTFRNSQTFVSLFTSTTSRPAILKSCHPLCRSYSLSVLCPLHRIRTTRTPVIVVELVNLLHLLLRCPL